jgi:hypothetical protein
MELDSLDGFAFIRETRTVHIPAGRSRVRFEGVADGIEPASALVTGLPDGLIEKDRDAALLSPSSLLAATVGKSVTLVRSNAKTGRTERVPGTVVSDGEGVVFQTAAGVEALRCSGLPETFTFTSRTGLSSTPTLSVLIQAAHPVTKTVTLSYLARGFDWSATYTATLSPDGTAINLGAWLTLANANGTGFPDAHTQVVAGRVNRESGAVDPIEPGEPIIARCWPQGNTSSGVEQPALLSVRPLGFEQRFLRVQDVPIAMSAPLQETIVTARRKVEQEQLGDLKLYRVPERTTVASRQSKQVRLLDRRSVPVRLIYSFEVFGELSENGNPQPASQLLLTKNTLANHLGLPLPSGSLAVFGPGPAGPLLLNETKVDDTAIAEDVEMDVGTSHDVQVIATVETISVGPDREKMIPTLPGVVLRHVEVDAVRSVEVTNARESAVQFELRLSLDPGTQLIRADHQVWRRRNGQRVFRFSVPAHQTVTVRYQTAHP